MYRYRILVIEHDDAIRHLLGELLAAEGYEVRFATQLTIGAADIRLAQPDMIIIELPPAFPDNTILLLTELRRDPANGGIAVIVSSTSVRTLRSLAAPLRQLGCSVLLKPFGIDHLLTKIQHRLHSPDGGHDADIRERAIG